MLGSVVIDVAIGLICVYLLMAVLASALVEALSGITNRRGAMLVRAIRELVGDELAKGLFKQPRISNILRGGDRSWLHRKTQCRDITDLLPPDSIAPAYIPAAMFTEALLESVCGNAFLVAEPQPDDLIRDICGEKSSVPAEVRPKLVSLVKEAVAAQSYRKGEITFLASLKREIQNWFDDGMDRLTGVYKRGSQIRMFVAALVVCLVVNADTINIVRTLSQHEATRTALVQYAEKVASAASAPTTQEVVDSVRSSELNFPLGWPQFPGPAELLAALIGILVTTLAASLGAPFWFDALQKFVNLRATGAKPPRADSAEAQRAASSSTSAAAAPPAASANLVTRPLMIDNFKHTQIGVSLDNAAILARCAKYGYIADSAILLEKLREFWPNCEAKLIDSGKSTQLFVASDDERVIVSFRGTEPTKLQDILADAKFGPVPGPWNTTIHSGFSSALDEVWKDLENEISARRKSAAGAEKPLWVTGHSLGAALATLATARWLEAGAAVAGLYTFGSPRVGKKDFAAAFNRLFRTNAVRFINQQDAVTRVPLWTMDFRHVGTDAYIDSELKLRIDPSFWFTAAIDTALEAARDLRRLPKDAVADHSMDLYVSRIDQIRARGGI